MMKSLNFYTPNGKLPRIQKCPVCHAQGEEDSIQKLVIALPGLSGDYCGACLKRWLSENIPKLQDVQLPVDRWPDVLELPK